MLQTYSRVVVLTNDDDVSFKKNAIFWEQLSLEEQKNCFIKAVTKIANQFKYDQFPVFVVGWEKMFIGTTHNGSLTHDEKESLKKLLSLLATSFPTMIFIINLKSISDVNLVATCGQKNHTRGEKLANAYSSNPFIFTNIKSFRKQYFHLLESKKEKSLVYNNTVYIFCGHEVLKQRKTCPFNKDSYDYSEDENDGLMKIFHPAGNHSLFYLLGQSFTVNVCLDFWHNPKVSQDVLTGNQNIATFSFTLSDTLIIEQIQSGAFWGKEKFHIIADSINAPLIVADSLDDVLFSAYQYSFATLQITEIAKNNWYDLSKKACEVVSIDRKIFGSLYYDVRSLIVKFPETFISFLLAAGMSVLEASEILTRTNLLNLFAYLPFFEAFNEKLSKVSVDNNDTKFFIMRYRNLDSYSLFIEFLPYDILTQAFFNQNFISADFILQKISNHTFSEFKSCHKYAIKLMNIFKILVLKNDTNGVNIFMRYAGIFSKMNLYSEMLQFVLAVAIESNGCNYRALINDIFVLDPGLMNLNYEVTNHKFNSPVK